MHRFVRLHRDSPTDPAPHQVDRHAKILAKEAEEEGRSERPSLRLLPMPAAREVVLDLMVGTCSHGTAEVINRMKNSKLTKSQQKIIIAALQHSPVPGAESLPVPAFVGNENADSATDDELRIKIDLCRDEVLEAIVSHDFWKHMADKETQSRMIDCHNNADSLKQQGRVHCFAGFCLNNLVHEESSHGDFQLLRDAGSRDFRRPVSDDGSVFPLHFMWSRLQRIREDLRKAGVRLDGERDMLGKVLLAQTTKEELATLTKAMDSLREERSKVPVTEEQDQAACAAISELLPEGQDSLLPEFAESYGDASLAGCKIPVPTTLGGLMRIANDPAVLQAFRVLQRVNGMESDFNLIGRVFSEKKFSPPVESRKGGRRVMPYRTTDCDSGLSFSLNPFDLVIGSGDEKRIDERLAHLMSDTGSIPHLTPFVFHSKSNVPKTKGESPATVGSSGGGQNQGKNRNGKRRPAPPKKDSGGFTKKKKVEAPTPTVQHSSSTSQGTGKMRRCSCGPGCSRLNSSGGCAFSHPKEEHQAAKAKGFPGHMVALPPRRHNHSGRQLPHQSRQGRHITVVKPKARTGKKPAEDPDVEELKEQLCIVYGGKIVTKEWDEARVRAELATRELKRIELMADPSIGQRQREAILATMKPTRANKFVLKSPKGQCDASSACSTPVPDSPGIPSDVGEFSDSTVDLTIEIPSFNQSDAARKMRNEIRAGKEKEGGFPCTHVHRMGFVTEANDYASAIVKLRKPGTSKFRKVKVALDTCSTVDEFTPEFARVDLSRPRERVQSRDSLSMTGQPACTELTVCGVILRIQGFVSKTLPPGCMALLSKPTLQHLIANHGLNLEPHLMSNNGESLPLQTRVDTHQSRSSTKGETRIRTQKGRKRVAACMSIDSPKNLVEGKRWKRPPMPKCLWKNCEKSLTHKQGGRGHKFCSHHCHRLDKKSKSKLKNEGEPLKNTYPDLNRDEGEGPNLGPEQAHGENPHVCFISNAKMESYLSRNPIVQEGEVKLKDNVDPHLRVTVNPDLPQNVQNRICALLKEHKAAFQTTHTGLCKPLNVPPVKFKLKHGMKLPRVPQQRFNPATERLSRHLTKAHVKSGLLEPAFTSSVASRTHFALKAASGERLDGPNFKVRECGDYREVNECIERIVPDVPDGHSLIRKIMRYSHHIEFDWHSAYNGIVVHPDHRHVLARHTALGLHQPTRLQFGVKNAQALFFSAKKHIHERDLQADTLANMHSFIDDDRSGKTADESWDVFCTRLEDILKTVIKNNATLRPEKSRIGFESTVFYGFEIKHGKSSNAEKNLAPIKTMENPTCQADVRRVLGIFVQSKNWVPNYASRTKPLTDLLRKGQRWDWGPKQQESFQFMRTLLQWWAWTVSCEHDPPSLPPCF